MVPAAPQAAVARKSALNNANNARRLLIIAPSSSYRLTPYLLAAKKLGLNPQIASTSQHSLLPGQTEGLPIDLLDPLATIKRIRQAAEHTPYIGIIGTDDATVELAAMAAAELGLVHNPVHATRMTRRKDLAREYLSIHNDAVPQHLKININDALDKVLADFPFPVVIKPLNLSASRGVIRADDNESLKQAIEQIRPLIAHSEDADAREYVLVEQYIDGIEIAIEAMLDQDELVTLAVFDKPDPLQGPYFEETYYITPSRLSEDILQRAQQCVLDACRTYGLITGPIHAELRIDDRGKPWILEVASRTIGGDCSRSLKPSTNHSLEELVISYAIGEPIKPEQAGHSSGVLMIPAPKPGILRRVEGLINAKAVEHITAINIDIPTGNEVQCLPDASSYLGFIFAEAETPEQVEAALRAAHAELEFVIAPMWLIGKA